MKISIISFIYSVFSAIALQRNQISGFWPKWLSSGYRGLEDFNKRRPSFSASKINLLQKFTLYIMISWFVSEWGLDVLCAVQSRHDKSFQNRLLALSVMSQNGRRRRCGHALLFPSIYKPACDAFKCSSKKIGLLNLLPFRAKNTLGTQRTPLRLL